MSCATGECSPLASSTRKSLFKLSEAAMTSQESQNWLELIVLGCVIGIGLGACGESVGPWAANDGSAQAGSGEGGMSGPSTGAGGAARGSGGAAGGAQGNGGTSGAGGKGGVA